MPSPSPSGRRLGAAVLAYLVAATGLITWAPFDFARRPVHGLCSIWSGSDLLLNVVMFLPLGFLLPASRARRGDTGPAGRMAVEAALAGVLLSALLETGQLFLAERCTSLLDVATNALGATLGALAFRALQPRLVVDSGTVRALALDLPLSGAIALLVPLLWTGALGHADPSRLVLLWPVAVTGGVLIGSVHGSYLSAASRGSWALAAPGASAWLLVSAAPALLRSASLTAAGHVLGAGLLAGLLAGWRSRLSAPGRRRADERRGGERRGGGEPAGERRAGERRRGGQRGGGRRVEGSALRLAMPTFAAYLALSALWPLTAVDGTWRAAWALAPAAAHLSRGLVLESLAHVAAFTVVGYVTAELRGRDEGCFARAWPRVLGRIAPLAGLLEWARGWNTTVGASATLGVLALAGGLFGGWLYHLQRDHVRGLRSRGAPQGAVRGPAQPSAGAPGVPWGAAVAPVPSSRTT
jgi:hypothetical protein